MKNLLKSTVSMVMAVVMSVTLSTAAETVGNRTHFLLSRILKTRCCLIALIWQILLFEIIIWQFIIKAIMIFFHQ